MKILLVNPEFPETYWSFRHALPFEGKRCVFPPLGLLTVSSLLPRSCERRLIDLNVEPLKDSHIEWADTSFRVKPKPRCRSSSKTSNAAKRNALTKHRSDRR